MKSDGQILTFYQNRNQLLIEDCDLNLYLIGILAGAQKCHGSQLLYDPFEEQVRVPSLQIKCGIKLLTYECSACNVGTLTSSR